jgi:hypothetical protein
MPTRGPRAASVTSWRAVYGGQRHEWQYKEYAVHANQVKNYIDRDVDLVVTDGACCGAIKLLQQESCGFLVWSALRTALICS